MDVNTRALDRALSVLGLTFSFPVNALVFNMHNAILSAADEGRTAGFMEGFEQGRHEGFSAGIKNAEGREYITGYAQGAADMQAEDAAEIEALEREISQVSREQYDDGYIDAVHDFGLSPEGARQQADFIEDQRALKAAELSLDPTIFPVDEAELA